MLLNTLRNERDHTMALTKRKLNFSDPVEVEYATYITPYALQFFAQQLHHRHKVRILMQQGSEFHVSSSEGILQVTSVKCQCKFWKTIKLPCRHILAVREKQQLLLFERTLVSKRWTLDYLKKSFSDKSFHEGTSESFQVTCHYFAENNYCIPLD